MLNYIFTRIIPVVKDLGSKDMPSYSPHTLISTFSQPLMPKLLSIEVVNLERAVMHVRFRICRHEESVMIDIISASVDMGKYSYILPLLSAVKTWNIQEVGRY